jgi:ABC-type histidine transport system ATPase subunit
VVCLIGPSGSGKSTVLRCINGLESYQGGEIRAFGERVDARSKSIQQLRSRMGMVFQRFNLFPHRTVLDNVMEGPVFVLGQARGRRGPRPWSCWQGGPGRQGRPTRPSSRAASSSAWPLPARWP